jgi:hypothetical protein
MLLSVCSRVLLFGVLSSCCEIVVYVVYIVSCGGYHIYPLLGIVNVLILWFFVLSCSQSLRLCVINVTFRQCKL